MIGRYINKPVCFIIRLMHLTLIFWWVVEHALWKYYLFLVLFTCHKFRGDSPWLCCVDLNHACSLSKQSLLKLSKIHISYKQWKSMTENFTLPAKQKVNFVIAWSRNFDFPLLSTFSFNFNACISISRQCYVILWDPNKLTINPLPLEAP